MSPLHKSFPINSWILFLLTAILLFFFLGSSPVYILDEAKNAQAAWEMKEKNEWIIPTFNAELRPHKPPLHYYFMRLSYQIWGKTPFAARFFSAVMGLSTIAVTWFFTKKFISRSAAYWSVMVLLLSTHFLFEFRLAVPDPYLIFFLTLGIFCFYAYVKEHNWKWLLTAAFSFGFSVLSKGPVAIAVPGISILLWLIIEKNLRLILSLKFLTATIVFLVVSLPWFIAIHHQTNGLFTKEFFITHNLERFSEPMEGHGGIFLLVPLFILLGLLPFSLLIREILRFPKEIKQHSLLLLSSLTALSFILFFSISGTKLPNYPMPAYPFIAILIGYSISRAVNFSGRLPLYFYIVLIVVNVFLFAGAFIALGMDPSAIRLKNWALTLAILPLTAAFSLYMRRFLPVRSIQFLCYGYVVFNFVFLSIAYPAIYKNNPVTNNISAVSGKTARIYAFRSYNPAFNFYLPRAIPVLLSREDVKQKLNTGPEVRIITRQKELIDLEGLKFRIIVAEKDLFEDPTTVIITADHY
jgi:4-amino-4-deoxy-L-arabinose transferase-like glycosyltransferase